MHDERDYTLACMYIRERLAAAERERLVQQAVSERHMQHALAARTGATLVRVGLFLQAAGASPPPPRFSGDSYGRVTR